MQIEKINASRRNAILWLARFLAALGLTGFGIKIGLQPGGKVPIKNQPDCQNCIFLHSTCVPKTLTCRKEND